VSPVIAHVRRIMVEAHSSRHCQTPGLGELITHGSSVIG
jgi:hypothetical protein